MSGGRAIPLLLLALAAPAWWRETNSHAAAVRGAKAWAAKHYPEAVTAYARAAGIAPSPLAAFNLGTSQIAAGDRTTGAATLEKALDDPSLAPDAFFNRGNAALAAGALDRAIRDFTETLRRAPGHAAAKRNLELALLRRQRQEQSSRGGDRGKQGDAQPQPAPSAGQQQKPREGDLDLEALLRSVQQQEQEELRRMKAKAGRGRVGW